MVLSKKLGLRMLKIIILTPLITCGMTIQAAVGSTSGDTGFIIDVGSTDGAAEFVGNTGSECSINVSVSWDGSGDPTANLRSGPGATYNKIGQVREGESYTVISVEYHGQNFSFGGKSNSTWYQIITPNGNAWLWGGYATSDCGGEEGSASGPSNTSGSSDSSGFIIDNSSSGDSRTGTADGEDTGFIIDASTSGDDFIDAGSVEPAADGGFIVDAGSSDDSFVSDGDSVSDCRLDVAVSWDGTGDPTANLRSGPGATYDKVGTVREGESYAVTSVEHNGQNFSYKGKSDSTWYQIPTASGQAWLWGGYANSSCGDGEIVDGGSVSGDSGFIVDDGSSQDGRTGTSDDFILPPDSSTSEDGGFIVDLGPNDGVTDTTGGDSSASGCRLSVSVSWDGSGDPTANLRSGPGASYSKIGQVREGESYTVISVDHNGQKFSFKGKSGSTWYQIAAAVGNAWLWGGYANSSCSAGDSSPSTGSFDGGFIVDDGSTQDPRVGTSDDFILPPDSASSDDGGFIVDLGPNDGSLTSGDEIPTLGCQLSVSVSWDGSGDPTANLRSGPGASYSKIGQVREGESYTVISVDHNGQNFSFKGKSDSTWYQIDAVGGNAWLWGGYANSSCPGDSSPSTGSSDAFDDGFIVDNGSSADSGFIVDDGTTQNARTGTTDSFILPADSSSDDGGFIVDMGPSDSGVTDGGAPVSGCQLTVNVSWDGSGDPTANLRSGPGASFGKVSTVTDGETYSVISVEKNGQNFSFKGKSDSTWYQISVNGSSAWLWGGYGLSDCSGGSTSAPSDSGFIIDDPSADSRTSTYDSGFIIDNS